MSERIRAFAQDPVHSFTSSERGRIRGDDVLHSFTSSERGRISGEEAANVRYPRRPLA